MKDAEEIILKKLKKEDLDKQNSHLINQIKIPELNKYIRKFTELVITRIQNNENLKKEFKEKFGKTFEEEFRDCKDDDEIKNKFKEKYKVKFKNIDIFKFFVKKIHQELQDENITNHFKPEDFIKFNAYFAININSIYTLDFEICTELIRQYIKFAKDSKVESPKIISDVNNKSYSILNYISTEESEQDRIEELLSVGTSQSIDISTVVSIDELYKIYNRICEINSDLEYNGKYVQDTYARYTTELKMYILLLTYIHYFKHIFLPKNPNNNLYIKELISEDKRNLIGNTHTKVTYTFFEIFLKRYKYKNTIDNLSQLYEKNAGFYFPNISTFFRPVSRDNRINRKKIPIENPILISNKFICLSNAYLIISECPFIENTKLDYNKDVISQILKCPYIFKPSTEQLNKTQDSTRYKIHYWCQKAYKEGNSCMNNLCKFFDDTQYCLSYYPKKIHLSMKEFMYYFPISSSKSQIFKLFNLNENDKFVSKNIYQTMYEILKILPNFFTQKKAQTSDGHECVYARADEITNFITRKKLNIFTDKFSDEFSNYKKRKAEDQFTETDEINKIDMKYINLAIEVFGKNRDIDDILIFAKTYNKIDSKLKSIN